MRFKKKSELISDEGKVEGTRVFDMVVLGICIFMTCYLILLAVMTFVMG